MEYYTIDMLNINHYNEHVTSQTDIREESYPIGNDIYFYPDGNGNIISLTKEYPSIVPKALTSSNTVSPTKKEADYITTFFMGSMAFVGLFVLFQLSMKSK
jgi:hypothetical protein